VLAEKEKGQPARTGQEGEKHPPTHRRARGPHRRRKKDVGTGRGRCRCAVRFRSCSSKRGKGGGKTRERRHGQPRFSSTRSLCPGTPTYFQRRSPCAGPRHTQAQLAHSAHAHSQSISFFPSHVNLSTVTGCVLLHMRRPAYPRHSHAAHGASPRVPPGVHAQAGTAPPIPAPPYQSGAAVGAPPAPPARPEVTVTVFFLFFSGGKLPSVATFIFKIARPSMTSS
jgi:hypothetical protein